MVDDFFDPKNPNQDCHSCEGPAEPCYVEPARLGKDFVARTPEFVTDPSCNQLSGSRLILVSTGLTVNIIALYATFAGQCSAITGMLSAVIASAATVYGLSQFKDLRWKWRAKDD